MKVLIAEDEVQMNRVLTTALTHEGYDVDSVMMDKLRLIRQMKMHMTLWSWIS